MTRKVKPWRYGHAIAERDRERSHCAMCDNPEPGLMCETVHGVCVAFYHYCAAHWYAPAANGGPSAAQRTKTDIPIADLLEQLAHARSLLELARTDAADYEKRWLAECRAHGATQRKLEAAEHELTCDQGDDCAHTPRERL